MFNNAIYSNYQGDIKSADDWRLFIAAGRNKLKRTYANNTTVKLVNEGKDVAIQLHSTDIVTITPKGYILNSGGWQSVTTKERLNRFTPGRIYQKGGIWYIDQKDGAPSLFYDGMLIDFEGYPVKPKATAKYEKQMKAIKKQAREYARGYVEALKAGAVDMPSGGDCWGCVGIIPGSGHIKDHIKERYYVPSLLVNAGRAAGYGDHQIGLMGIGGHRLFINPEQNIYKYVVKQLAKEAK